MVKVRVELGDLQQNGKRRKEARARHVAYLGDVDLGTFGPRHHHGLEVVVLGKRLLGRGASLVPGVVQDPVDLVLKGLPQGVARGGLQLIVVSLLNDLEGREQQNSQPTRLTKIKPQSLKPMYQVFPSNAFLVQPAPALSPLKILLFYLVLFLHHP